MAEKQLKMKYATNQQKMYTVYKFFEPKDSVLGALEEKKNLFGKLGTQLLTHSQSII